MAPLTDLQGALPAPAPRALIATAGWTTRLRDQVSAYLPLLLMALLALGTWWLVNNSTVTGAERATGPARHVPDYTMGNFTVQRFAREGALRVQIEGTVLRHYPDNDTLEVDQPRIRAYAADGQVTVATAARAISNGDGTEVQLLGGAQVVRQAATPGDEVEFRGEFLHAFLDTQVVRSHLPVTVRRGAAVLNAATLDYRHADQRVQLNGRVRATFAPARGGAASAP